MASVEPGTNLFRAPAGEVERRERTRAFRREAGDPFVDDRLTLRQGQVRDSRELVDAQGRVVVVIERNGERLNMFILLLVATLIFMGVGGAAVWLAVTVVDEEFAVGMVMGGVFLAVMMSMVAMRLLAPRRWARIRKPEASLVMVEIQQDRRFQPVVATFVVRDASGEVLARLRKNYLGNLWRRRWQVRAKDAEPLFTIVEDHQALAFLRRLFGPLFGLLRTNFTILDPQEQPVGRLLRGWSLKACYVLDLAADLDGVIDRRIAVAVTVMLDAAERR